MKNYRAILQQRECEILQKKYEGLQRVLKFTNASLQMQVYKCKFTNTHSQTQYNNCL